MDKAITNLTVQERTALCGRLRVALQRGDYTSAHVADQIGVSDAAVRKWAAVRPVIMSVGMADRLVRFLGDAE